MQNLALESFLHKKFGLGGGAVGADAIFDGDDAVNVLAERGVNNSLLGRDMAVNDGQVFLDDAAVFPNFTEFAGGKGILDEQDDAAGFAVETVYEMGTGRLSDWMTG